MRTAFHLKQPEKIEATMTITMPLEDWKALRDELSARWPAAQFSDQIGYMVKQAEQVFVGDTDG